MMNCSHLLSESFKIFKKSKFLTISPCETVWRKARESLIYKIFVQKKSRSNIILTLDDLKFSLLGKID